MNEINYMKIFSFFNDKLDYWSQNYFQHENWESSLVNIVRKVLATDLKRSSPGVVLPKQVLGGSSLSLVY